jgi:hypothetical protein
MGSAKDFLDDAGGGESFQAVKFANVKDHVIGTIITEPKTVMRESLNKPGTQEEQLPINLDTDGTDEGRRTLWVRKGFLAGAVKEAVIASGAPGLQVGGKLTVQHTELRDTGKVQPAKVFKAKYEPPVSSGASVTEGDIFGDL